MRIILALIVIQGILSAQISVTSVRELSIPRTEQWSNPRYSPDGRSIFVTNTEMNGIWEYSLVNGTMRMITDDPASGFGFTIAQDGGTIAYRTTVREHSAKGPRLQRSVSIDRRSLSKKVLQEGSSVDLPFFLGNDAAVQRPVGSVPTQIPSIIGVDERGISILRNGKVVSVSPFENGQYIWPVLSPDGTRIAAVDMNRGAFICDVDGNNVVRMGRCNSPQWTGNGKWVIGMNDTDDGHVIINSEIIAVSADGKSRIQLTETPAVLELFPAVNPRSNEIAVSTQSGSIILITFTEGK